MCSASVMVPGAPPDFVNLSLFICRLFIGGNFKMANILYHPKVFDRRLIAQIHSNCAEDIPMMFVDIRSLENTSPDRKKANHILQLNFLPAKKIRQYSRLIIQQLQTSYRVLIFFKVQSPEFDKTLLEQLNVMHLSESRYLILVHDAAGDTIDFYILQRLNGIFRIIKMDNQMFSSPEDLFHNLENAFPITLGVHYDSAFCMGKTKIYAHVTLKSKQMIANYYYHQLGMEFIADVSNCFGQKLQFKKIKMRRHIPKSVYNELSPETELIDPETRLSLTKHPIIALHLEPEFFLADPLYTFALRNLRMIFVYGSDYQRQPASTTLGSLSIHGYFWPMYLLFLLLAIALYVLRRRANVPETGLCASLVEVWSVGIAGGEIRCRHHWERVLFAIAMISSFFVVSVILAKFSMHSTTDDRFETIDTIGKLSKQQKILFISPLVKRYAIKNMLSQKLDESTQVKSMDQLKHISRSHVLVVPESMLEIYKHMLTKYGKDYDVIDESLGSTDERIYLKSLAFIPQETIDKFIHATSALVESGLNGFYSSMANFLFQMENRLDSPEEEDEERAISLYEFRFPLILCGGCLLFALPVFVSEIIWFCVQDKCRQFAKRVWKRGS